jgi:glycine/D-amino acid oxidase-like deaminating enzyme
VRPDGAGFTIDTPAGPVRAAKLVLAAGHGTPALADPLGLRVPMRGQRGQILVTERLQPFLPLPSNGLRQTADGTVLLGATHEDDVGMDTGTTLAGEAWLAAAALRVLPDLARVRFVRAWAGLRILSPDGCPVYHRSEVHPGAYAAICHSGVTLAAVHANDLAEAILADRLPDALRPGALRCSTGRLTQRARPSPCCSKAVRCAPARAIRWPRWRCSPASATRASRPRRATGAPHTA